MAIPLPHVDGVEHRFVTVGDLRLHVAEAGAGEPVVLLHGWPQHWYEWRHLIPGLAARYRVICPDLRGFGWSDAPPGAYAKERLAEDLLRLLDALGLERVRLVGHDWGGLVGFLACLREPDRFARFLALNIIHPWPRLDPRSMAELWRPAHVYLLSTPVLGERLLRHRPELVRSLLRVGARHPDAFTEQDLDLFAAPLREPARARATVALYRTFLLCELPAITRGRYAGTRLRTPTLLLFGAGDPAISVRALPGFEPHADDMSLELVPDAGHFIAEERPDLVLDRALRLFEGDGG